MKLRLSRFGIAFLVCSISAGALQSCASLNAGEFPTTAQGTDRRDIPPGIRTLGADDEYTVVPSAVVAERLQVLRRDAPLNILALSGGGAAGAFGAGAIVGLTRSGRRPQFAVVTGVSAGALIAPYAFLGPAWDRELTEIYTSGVGEQVLQSRGLGAMFGSSMYRGSPLRQLVDRFATDAMIRAIASEAGKGRLLLVATTDFATGEPVVWDLGAIAMHGGPNARTRFRDVLVASASVPGIFPPIVLQVRENGVPHNELHVDGAVTVPFFVAPSPADLPGDVGGGNPDALYVIIDGQLREAPRTTPLRASAIVTRSVGQAMSRMTRTTLELTATTAQQRGIALDYAAIPAGYPYHDPFDFRAATVSTLFRYAAECAEHGRLWTAFQQGSDSSTDSRGSTPRGAECPADDTSIPLSAGSAGL
jgi:predicted acylesterase/phospholipase RssA